MVHTYRIIAFQVNTEDSGPELFTWNPLAESNFSGQTGSGEVQGPVECSKTSLQL